MNIWADLPKPFFVLAPMDDVTDTVFRRLIAGLAKPDLFMTEFVNVDGLQSAGREALLKKLRFSAEEQPIIAQVWGKVPENYLRTSRELVDMGFDGIDINMGCPDKTVLKNGCCAAFIDNRELASLIIKSVRHGAAGKVPVSVKTRLGLNKVDLSWHEFLLQQGIDAMIVHGRTAKQMSDVPADWDTIGKIRDMRDRIAPATRIIGNGDVLNRQQGQHLADKYKLDGIMIGRGVFQDPYIFTNPASGRSPWLDFTKVQRIALYRRHVELFASTWRNGERKVHTLNKFCKIYITGFDGAKELRELCMQAKTTDELLRYLTA